MSKEIETQPASITKNISFHPDQVAWLMNWSCKTGVDFTKLVRSFVDAMIQDDANGIKPKREILDEQTRREYIQTLNIS